MRPCRCRGFALAEVLVAAALLAVGLLGQLALLGSGLRAERDAANSATAATLAADFAERLRANSSAAAAYALDPDSEPSPAHCAVAAPFDAPARAACDLVEWQREVASSLPGATVEVVSTDVAGSSAMLYSISIRWVMQGSYRGEYSLQLQV